MPKNVLAPPRMELRRHLRVVPPVVAVAEEGEDADDQAHHHEQGQGHQEKPSTQGNPRATPNEQDEELLHPPVDTKDPVVQTECWQSDEVMIV